MLKRLKRWRVAFAILAAVVVAAPFLLRHRASFYTDGQELRSPRASVQKVLRKVLWEPPRLVGPAVNDPALDDYEPTESPFGELLVFTRGRPGENADLWSASRERGRWTRARPLEGINTAADELGAAFSADGEWLYFYSNRPGGLGGYDIWASRRTRRGRVVGPEDEPLDGPSGEPSNDPRGVAAPGGWAEPVNVGPAINTPWNEMSPALDTRRGVLYFTSDRRPDGAGVAPWWSTVRSRLNAVDYDIYVAARAGEVVTEFNPTTGFSPATALEAVNESPWAEGAVTVSPAGDFLYFSSNRPQGQGGFDLYRVRLADGEPMIPETLGPTVNTAGDELDPALASRGFELYFSRRRDGQEDLFVTVSKEVYVESEVGDPYWTLAAILEFLIYLIRLIPPSVLIVLAYLLLCLLLLLLMKALWGERLGTLGVLARCFLLALFVHLLLAIWMNKNDVERLVLQVFDSEEVFDAFEVSIGGLPEENVALAIREAVAATASDEPPTLTAHMKSLTPASSPASGAALARSALREPLETARADLSLDRLARPLAGPLGESFREPAHSIDVEAEPVMATVPDNLLQTAVEPGPPQLADRTPRMPEPETAPSPRAVVIRPMLPPMATPNTAISPPPVAPLPAQPPPVELRESVLSGVPSGVAFGSAEGTALGRASLPPLVGEPVRDAAIRPQDLFLPKSEDQADTLIADVAQKRRPSAPPTRAALPERRQLSVSRGASVAAKPFRKPTPRLDMGSSSPMKSGSAVIGWQSSTRRSLPVKSLRRPERGELTSSLRPLTPSGRRPVMEMSVLGTPAAVSSVESTSSFTPQIYRMREPSRREEALAESGGTEATEAAVRAGLAWLALHQSPDGRWTLDDYARHLESPSVRDLRHRSWDGRSQHDSRGGRGSSRAKRGDTAATGLALLAFLGHGDTHLEEGPHRVTVERGLHWLLSAEKANGDLRGGGNLYMHSVAAFALCEAYAFTRDPALRESAQRAIDFTVRTQHPRKGGWRYDPYPESSDVDTSVFGWMLMALKSGRMGELRVDERVLVRAAGYLDSARMTERGGRYAYQPGQSRTSLAITAQGFFSHQMLVDSLLTEEQKDDPELRRADEESISYLMANLPRAADMEGVNFYYWYYATLALFQEGGEPWEIWNARLSDLLVDLQVGREHGTAYGSWDPRGKRARTGGRLYSTAFSILCLEVYYRYARLRPK